MRNRVQIKKKVKLDLSYCWFFWAVWGWEGEKLASSLGTGSFQWRPRSKSVETNKQKSRRSVKRQRPPFSQIREFRIRTLFNFLVLKLLWHLIVLHCPTQIQMCTHVKYTPGFKTWYEWKKCEISIIFKLIVH